MAQVSAVTGDEVAAAAERIAGHVAPTPVLRVEPGELLDGQPALSAPLACKLDLLAPTGSFKVRGATSLLTGVEVPDAGVVAASGGNFGLAIAWAARRLGHRATVFVSELAPAAKLDAIEALLGAGLRVVAGSYADAQIAADEHIAATGALRAHPYDQREVVAGQGTATRELLAEVPDLTTLLLACGGGGLLAGTVAAAGERGLRIIAVETEQTPTLRTARVAGEPVDVEVGGIAASALGARRLGSLAWAAQPWVHGTRLVTDEAVRDAQRRLWHACRLVTEPGGATALAALTSGAYEPGPGEVVGVLLCGANTDPAEVR